MWSYLHWVLHVGAWCSQVAWINLYYLLGLAGFVRVAWEIAWGAFQAGRRYQMRRIRELLARVRENRPEKELTTGESRTDAA